MLFSKCPDLSRTEKLERFMVNFDEKATVFESSSSATQLVEGEMGLSFCWAFISSDSGCVASNP